MILLTDEEIGAGVGDFILEPSFGNLLNYVKDSNKAQLRKVVEWLTDSTHEVNQRACSLGDIPVVLLHKEKLQALLKEIE